MSKIVSHIHLVKIIMLNDILNNIINNIINDIINDINILV